MYYVYIYRYIGFSLLGGKFATSREKTHQPKIWFFTSTWKSSLPPPNNYFLPTKSQFPSCLPLNKNFQGATQTQ